MYSLSFGFLSLDKIVDITNINFHDSVEILAIKNGLIIYEMSKKLRN